MNRFFAIALVAALTSACEDPVLRQKAESLGPDPGRYEDGPNHRAGFPCTWCHTDGGTASPILDLGGTVYANPSTTEPLKDVLVHLFDRKGRTLTLPSNRAGNFFLAEGALPLEFPIWVKLEYGDQVTAMQSPIFRERSCAGCHMDPANPASAGHVYLWEDP